MKKISLLATLCFLTACVYGGDIRLMKPKNQFFSSWKNQKIDYYIDSDEYSGYLVGVEEVTFDEIDRGIAKTTRTGALMVSSKTDVYNTLETEVLKATKNAVLSSSYSPFYIHRDDVFTPFGEVQLGKERYMLVQQGDRGDILLIDGQGRIFNHIGRMKGDRLAILDTYFFIEPEDVRILPAMQTTIQTEQRINGFELYYTGISGDEMTFTYVWLDDNFDKDVEVEQYSFPLDECHIEIQGLNIDILDVDYGQISYIVN